MAKRKCKHLKGYIVHFSETGIYSPGVKPYPQIEYWCESCKYVRLRAPKELLQQFENSLREAKRVRQIAYNQVWDYLKKRFKQ